MNGSDPSTTGTDNGTDLVIHSTPTDPASASVNPATVCSGESTPFTLTYEGGSAGGSGGELKWYEGSCGTGTYIGSGNGVTVTRTLTSNATFYCRWESISCGNSACTSTTVTVNPILPVSVYITATSTTICEGSNVTFTAHPTNGGTPPTYQWNRNGTPLPGETGATFTTNTLVNHDEITVTMTSTATCPNPATVTSEKLTITVNPNLEPSVTILESANPVCQGSQVTFTATPVNGGSTPSYQWKVNGTNTGTNSPIFNYTPNNGDQVSVTMTTSATCRTKEDDDSNIISMVVNPVVTPSVSVSASDNNFCPGTTITFTATPTHGGTTPTYQWKINGTPVGSNSNTFVSSTLNNGDIVSVTLTSNAPCVTPPEVSDDITMVVKPGTLAVPSTITGETAVCPGTPQTYSVPSDPAATTYTWTLPAGWSLDSGQGTHFITVTSGIYGQNGTISVTAGNACGTSTARTLNVAVNPGTPAQPAAISGSTEVCPNTSNHTYSIAPVSGATIYTWSLPSGWTINSGQNSTVITVTSGDSGNGYVTVTAGNSCGTSTPQSLPVTVKAGTPSVPSAISGTAAVCPGTPVTYSVTPDPAATSYNWIVPAGWNITSGGGTHSITVTSGSYGQDGSISVTAANSCGTSSPSTLNVSVNHGAPATPGAISGNNNLCINSTGITYSVAPDPTATAYTWSVPSSGWSITSGQGTPSITISTSGSAVSGNITVFATNGCGNSNPTILWVDITMGVPATPGPISGTLIAICPEKSPSYSVDPVNGATSYTWQVPAGWIITSGNGTPSINTKVPSGASSGYVTVTANNVCGSSGASSLQVSVNNNAYISAGPDQTVCYGTSSVNLAGAIGGAINNKNAWDWIEDTFYALHTGIVNPDILNTRYNLPNNGNITGQVKIKIKPTKFVGCPVTEDEMIINVLPIPDATFAGTTPIEICSGNSASLAISGTANTTVTFKINGGADQTLTLDNNGNGTIQTGTLTVATTTNFVYQLTRIAYDTLSTCYSVLNKSFTVTIYPLATVNAGPDNTICSGETYTMQGSFGGGAASATWTTSGNGTFSSNAPNAVYTPGSADLSAGSVTLTYTSEDPAGPCGSVSDQMVLTLKPAPTVEAGDNLTICQSANPSPVVLAGASFTVASSAAWSITSGGGELSATAFTSSPATVTYTPQPGYTGTVTLTLTTNDPDGPCSAVSDTRTIQVNPAPGVNAGADQEICAGSTVTLNGNITSPASSASWSGGGGSFDPGPSDLHAIYTPSSAEVLAGTVTLTLTTDDPDGPCGAVSDQVVITIRPLAVAQAGPDQPICSGSTISLNGSVGGGATSGSWTGGSGTFNPDRNSLQAIYTPSPAEVNAGTVTLSLQTNDPDGACTAATDDILITINAAATVDAGIDQVICSGTPVTLAGSSGGGANSVTWTGGNGTFTPDANTATATYTPTPAEIAAGTVTLTLTTDDPVGPCGAVSDAMVITIEKGVVITTQPVNTGICANKGNAALSVAASGTITGYQWYKGTPPSGTPVSEGGHISGTATSTLLFSPATLSDDGTYYVVVKGKTPCSDIPSNTASLNVDESIAITNPPSPQTVCEGGSVTFSVTATPADGLQYQWKLNGTPISGANAATYSIEHATPANAGNYTVEITGPTGYTCSSIESVSAMLTVIPTPVVNQPADVSFCSGTTTPSIVFTGGADGTVYNWINSNTAIGLGASGQGDITAFTAAHSGTTPLSATITVTPTIVQGGVTCTGASKTFTITVNATPAASVTPSQSTICSGSAISISLSANITGTTFTWTSQVISGTVEGNGNCTTGTCSSTIADVLTNTGTTNGVVKYTIIPTAYGCQGSPVEQLITVYPKPVGSASPQTICNGRTTHIELNSTVSGSAFTWTAAQLSGATIGGFGGCTTNCGTAIDQTLTNNGTGSGVVRYTITPEANGCAGDPFTADVTVHPTPNVVATPSASSICSGNTVTINLSGAVTGTEFTWTTTPSGTTVTGFSDCSGSNCGNTISQTLFNNGADPATVKYTITPTFNGCTGVPEEVTITVNPGPTGSGADQAICSGGTTSVALSSNVNDPVFTWTATLIGGTISGFADCPSTCGTTISQTLTNSGTTAGVVRYRVTPSANGCVGTPFDVNVTVLPLPMVDNPGDKTVCAGSTVTVGFTGTGSRYEWSNDNTTIGLAATGTGDISFTAGNTGSVRQTATITVTPVFESGGNSCSGTPIQFTISVDPVSAGGTIDPLNRDHCSGIGEGTITLQGQTGTVTGWEYSTDGLTWNSAPGSTPSASYYYNITVPTRYRAIVQSGGCPEVRSPVSAITVIPELIPQILTPPPTMCSGEPVTLVAQVTTTTGTIINPGSLSGGNFASSNPEGWLVDGQPNNFPAAADNRAAGPWGISNAHFHNPRLFSGIWYATNSTNTDNKIAIANGQHGVTTVETPVFSLLGGNDPVLKFEMGYHLMNGCSAKIEISVNGGLSYTDMLVLHTPSQGTINYGTGSGATQTNPRILKEFELDLSNFVDQQNLKLRFYYSSTQPGSSWAIDNLNVPPGSFIPITYGWSPSETLTPSDGQTVVANPTETTTYTLYTRMGNCEEVTPVTVVVSVLPSTLYWKGTESSDWFDNDNWEYPCCPGSVHFYPRHCTDVVIPGGKTYYPIVSSPLAACRDLTIQPKGELTISTGGTITMDGVASIESDSETSNGSMIVYGNLTSKQAGDYVIYHRYLNTGRYYMVSSPVLTSAFNSNADLIKNRTSSPTEAFGVYNEVGNVGPTYFPFGSIPPILTNGKGYYIYTENSGTIPFSGALNKGTITTPVQRTAPRHGWNAVGNPFTSAIRITGSGSTDNFLGVNDNPLHSSYTAIYVWNNSGYRVICNSGYPAILYPGGGFYGGDDPGFAQPGQGFLINVDTHEDSHPDPDLDVVPGFVETHTNISFTSNMQLHHTGGLLKSAVKPWNGITLLANSGNQVQATVVAFHENMTTGLDPSYDVGALSSGSFRLYTDLVTDKKGIEFAIQSLPENSYETLEVPVGLNLPQGGNLSFKADGILLPEGIYPILEDRQLKVKTMLKTVADSYTVSLPGPTYGTGRFFLSFGNLTPAAEVEQPEPRYSAWFANQKIVIYGTVPRKATAILYDLNGRILGQYPLQKENRNEIAAQHLANGMYILHIQGETGTQVMKVVVVYE